MENTNNNVRSRVWFCTAYGHIEELFAEALHVLPNLVAFISAKHDKDVNEDGSPKETHYHIMIANRNAVVKSTIEKIFKTTMKDFTEDTNFIVLDMKGSWGQASAYMLHDDVKSREAGKHQYGMESVTEHLGHLFETPENNAAQADIEPAMALMYCIANGYSFPECIIQFGAFAIFNYKKIAEGLVSACPAMDEIINRPKHTKEELMEILNCDSVQKEVADTVEDFQPREMNVAAHLEAHAYLERKKVEQAQTIEAAAERMKSENIKEPCSFYNKTGAADKVDKKAVTLYGEAAVHNVKAFDYEHWDDEENQTCPDDEYHNESDWEEEEAQEEIEVISAMLSDKEISLPEALVKSVVVQMKKKKNYDSVACLSVLSAIGGNQ